MSDYEKIVDNADIPAWQTGLASAVNDTYSYANNSLFYAMIPTYYRDWAWRYCRVAIQWLDGYVWNLHQGGISGIISTRIANKLITGLTKQVVGEKLLFKCDSKDYENASKTLDFVSKWAEEQNILKAVYSGVGFALGVGTSCIKLNKTIDGNVWWEAVRFDNCFYSATFRNEVKEATFVIRNYVDTREGKSNNQFFLVEHRYYQELEPLIKIKADGSSEVVRKKGDKVAMIEYKVHRVTGTVNNNLMPQNIQKTSLNWEELPKEIRDAIKLDYGTIRIGEPQELGFPDLAVYPLLNGEIDLGVPTGTNFGESMIVGIQDDLITYELASSYQIRDMYLGKGTVYVPKSLNLADTMLGTLQSQSVLGGIGETKYETVKGVDPDKQQIVVQQFELRSQEWQSIMENCLKRIAVKWGMSPKILASFLANGASQMTATQVDSEDDMSIAFIYHTRAYFKNALNKALETTLNFYGYPCNITVDFASPSLINKDRLLNRVKEELDIGLIDIEEAVRIMNPDLTEEGIQAKVGKAISKQQELKQQEQDQFMNSFGELGEEEPIEEESDQLEGSTEPAENKDYLQK